VYVSWAATAACGNLVGGVARLEVMRRILRTLVVTTLAGSLGACTSSGPEDPARPAPDGLSPTPRVQVGAWTPLADLPQSRTELSAVVIGGPQAGFSYSADTEVWRP
jgi:hypothetical protein